MNLREYSTKVSSRHKSKQKEEARTFLLTVNIGIFILICVISFLIKKHTGMPEGMVWYLFGCLLFILFLLNKESWSWAWSELWYINSDHIKYAICYSCYKKIDLVAGPGQGWECNYCSGIIQGNVLDKCPECGEYQRSFDCPYCNKVFDIHENYDEESRKRAGDAARTREIAKINRTQ